MPYNPWTEPGSAPIVSEYNAAALKMKRLDKLQDTLNQVSINLLNFNQQYQKYNFEIKFNTVKQLYQEVDSKCNSQERKDATALINAITTAIEKYPIFSKKTRGLFESGKVQINHSNWKVIGQKLFEFESKIRELIDMHGMDTKYADNDEDEI